VHIAANKEVYQLGSAVSQCLPAEAAASMRYVRDVRDVILFFSGKPK
jgi:hypothetical protein